MNFSKFLRTTFFIKHLRWLVLKSDEDVFPLVTKLIKVPMLILATIATVKRAHSPFNLDKND